MKRGFVVTPQAREELREILLDIAEDSPETAERLRREFNRAFIGLGQSPGIGHYREELLPRLYRFWNFYSYVVAYAWEEKPIQIISVVHGARNLAVFFTIQPRPRSE